MIRHLIKIYQQWCDIKPGMILYDELLDRELIVQSISTKDYLRTQDTIIKVMPVKHPAINLEFNFHPNRLSIVME